LLLRGVYRIDSIVN